MLSIAIQKSGRLSEDSIRLLNECGLGIPAANNTLKVKARHFPLEVFFLRDDDIPEYVQDAVADLGIVGENVLRETGKDVAECRRLGFAKCRLSLAIPRDQSFQKTSDLAGKRIATSYPKILGQFLAETGVEATIQPISGSVEIAPGIGLADAVCDLVSSGSTLLMNGLKEVKTILHSEALLVRNKQLSADKLELLDQLLFRMEAVQRAARTKYVLMNAPTAKLDEIIAILPGIKSPTVLPLALEGWSSIHSVIEENDFWALTAKLKAAGAEGILVIPIEKMIS